MVTSIFITITTTITIIGPCCSVPPSIGSVKNLPEAKLCASPLLQITLQHPVHIKRQDYSSGSYDPWRIFFACTVQLRKTWSGSPETLECQQLGVVRDQEIFFFWRLKIPASSLSKILKIATVTYMTYENLHGLTGRRLLLMYAQVLASWSIAGGCMSWRFLRVVWQIKPVGLPPAESSRHRSRATVHAYSLAASQLIKWSVGSLLNNRRAPWHRVHNKNKSRCCWQ